MNLCWQSNVSVFNMLSESESEIAQLCPTLCDPMDCSLLGSSVHGIFQARVLEWVAISFSRGSSLCLQRSKVCLLSVLYWQVDFLPLSHLGSSMG